MNKRILNLLFSLALTAGVCAPVFAAHGVLSTNERDAWIDSRLNDLFFSGLVERPKGALKDLTNLRVAQLTAEASEKVMAQADLPLPPMDLPMMAPGELPLPNAAAPSLGNLSAQASKSLRDLVEEFKSELSAMDVSLAQLEDKLFEQKRRAESFREQQTEYLKKTGTDMYAYSRGVFNIYRGYGLNAAYSSMDYNDIMLMDFGWKSVPVPFLLFDTRVRVYRTIGLYYSDPINPTLLLRWISLTNFNEVATFTAGDFFEKYTPLTLWNYEVPVYTFLEPTSFKRSRKDLEEFVYMGHGNDWHMRGFRASTAVAWPESDVLGKFKLQTMAGELKSATQISFSNYFAGSQASIGFFGDNLEFKGVGLLLWDDPTSSTVPYLPDFSPTFAKQYQIGSLTTRFNLPIADQVSFTGSLESAFNQFQDDSNNLNRAFQDWALLGKAEINILGAHLNAKYLNIGPFFYSPGAQTNRYSALPGANGYLSTNLFLDNGLTGYRNSYLFQGVNRPSFAIYDRTVENMLPYGDSTPNRLGMIFGFSIDIGKDGWLKPQASYVLDSSSLGMHEITSNYVLNSLGDGAVAVENNDPNVMIRTFGGWEAAVGADIAKGLNEKEKTYFVGFDYKNQKTDLGLGNPFITNTMIAAADFSLPIPTLDSLVGSVAYVRTQSEGNEFVLAGAGNPSTYANYPFYLDSSSVGSYAYLPLNITKTTWAFGMVFPFTKDIRFKGDLFLNQYTWTDVPGYDRREEIWRLNYEASF